MHRREFIQQSLAAAAAATLLTKLESPLHAASTNVAARQPDGHSLQNRAPLQPAAFLKLPIGSTKARGWLRHQLDLQIDGLNGRMSEISDYLDYDKCGWVHPELDAWEELPYWLRGFGDLGYVTSDERVLALTRKWVDGILANQQPDGYFGPERHRTSLDNGPDLWPHMLVLTVLQSHYDAVGDPRILPFLTRYFHFVAAQPDERFTKGWASTRWGDAVDTVLWLYNRTGDSFLIDLAKKIHRNMADWTNGIPTWHNVNLAQGFREPAQFWLVSGDPTHLNASTAAYETVMRRYGQFPGGGFAGDENCRAGYRDPRQGFETCGYVEFMRSFEILTRISGDPVWSDRCEDIAFNSLPAAFDPEQKGLHYITCANSVALDNEAKKHGQFSNDWAMLAYMPGVHNYRCCPHNYGMAWPYYVEEMWLATPDHGLCASLYGPSEVSASVGNGETVHIAQSTEYPFDDAIQFKFSTARPVAFPLYLRIPGWCRGASARVNGKRVDADAAAGSYLRIDREWRDGDTVQLQLPMEIALRRWDENGGSVSVDRGPLTYSLQIDEDWKRIGGTDRWPEYTVSTTSPWNFGLVLDRDEPAHSFAVSHKAGALAANPFTRDTVPITLTSSGRAIASWQADSENVVEAVPQSPADSAAPDREITLIPMAAARLRITAFPVVDSKSST